MPYSLLQLFDLHHICMYVYTHRHTHIDIPHYSEQCWLQGGTLVRCFVVCIWGYWALSLSSFVFCALWVSVQISVRYFPFLIFLPPSCLFWYNLISLQQSSKLFCITQLKLSTFLLFYLQPVGERERERRRVLLDRCSNHPEQHFQDKM